MIDENAFPPMPSPGQQQKLEPREGYRYLCELVAEYLKTLPNPVRIPVLQAVNASSTVVANALAERDKLLKMLSDKMAEDPPKES